MRLTERCSCGASIDVRHELVETALAAVLDWRDHHIHTPVRMMEPTNSTTGSTNRVRTFPGMQAPNEGD